MILDEHGLMTYYLVMVLRWTRMFEISLLSDPIFFLTRALELVAHNQNTNARQHAKYMTK